MSQAPLTVAIDGATGFVGVHAAEVLARCGHSVVALVREGARAEDTAVLASMGARVVQIDFGSAAALEGALTGCDRLVHLIGSIAPPRGTRLADLHQGTAARVFRAAAKVGVGRAVIVTALGAGADARSTYHRTKWLAEEELRASGLPWVVLRPSLIVGRAVGHRDSKMVRRYLELIQKKRRVPLVFGGRNPVQPIAVNDLADAIRVVLEQRDFESGIFELGGGEVMKTREFVARLMRAVGVVKPFVSLPGPVAWIAASAFELTQRVPLLSRDQLRIARTDGVCKRNALIEDLGITPTPIDEAIRVYAEAKPRGIA